MADLSLNVWNFTWDSLMGQFFYVITLDQHVIHRRTRVIHLKRQLSRSWPIRESHVKCHTLTDKSAMLPAWLSW